MTRSPDTGKFTKSAMLRKMLQARAGAGLSRLCEATGWQQHSVRAALSRLRKAGYTIELREAAKTGGEARYRITGRPGGA
jgi:DNA-binding transcriptional regulator PaaX